MTTITAYRYSYQNRPFYDDRGDKPLCDQTQQNPVSIAVALSRRARRLQYPSVKIQQPIYIRCIAQWLCRLPFEILLCYPILEGIPIETILQLSGSLTDVTNKFDLCIPGRKEYQLVFPSTEHLANLRNTFLFLYELRVSKGLVPIPPDSPLARTASELEEWKPPNIHAIRIYLIRAIESILTRPGTTACPDVVGPQKGFQELTAGNVHRYLEAQCQNPERSDKAFSSVVYLERILRRTGTENKPYWFRQFERPIFALRAEQMACMADLVEEYPELLKEASDYSSEPRPNWKHLVSNLRARAYRPTKCTRMEKYSHPNVHECSHGAYLFRYDLFPLVPSDKSLALFVLGMTKILPALPAELVEVMGPYLCRDSNRPSLPTDDPSHKSSSVRQVNEPFAKLCLSTDKGLYPPNMLKDIKIAVEGIAFVHTLPDGDTGIKPTILRTRWTPWSAEPFRGQYPIIESLDQETSTLESFKFVDHYPVFMSPPCPHLDRLPPDKLDKRCERFYMPNYWNLHSLREFEWLGAFCRTVRFLEKVVLVDSPAY